MAFGRARQRTIAQSKADLVAQNLTVYRGLPASNIWGSGPLDDDTVALYNGSMILMLAQQNQLQSCPAPRNERPSANLQRLLDKVPLTERKKAVPVCDPKYP